MVAIIIRGKDGHALTQKCVASIRRNTPGGTYGLILVDDGSEPPYPTDWADDVIRHDKSLGAVSATNSGIKTALDTDAEYICVMDNDTQVPDGDTGWLGRFVAALEEYPDTGCVGATTGWANPPQHILATPPRYTADWTKGKKDNDAVVWFVSFCCLMRREVVEKLGPWDERYNPGNWEDTDYAMQMRTSGHAVRVANSVYIHHEGHKTFGADLQKLIRTNHVKFVEKWGPGRLWDYGLLNNESMGTLVKNRVKAEA